jgi:cellobiose phosphorylase
MERTLASVHRNLKSHQPLDHGIDADRWAALLNKYAHFVDRRDADGFVVDSAVNMDDLHSPRPSLHLMASCHDRDSGVWGSFWDQFGGGFSCLDSVLAGRMTSHLDTNYVPTAPEPQDCRGFFLHENGNAWPMFPIAWFEESAYSDIECVQGLDWQSLRAEREELLSELEVCVHPELPFEVWRVRITNRSERRREFSWFSRVRVNIDSFPSHYFVPRVVCEGLREQDALVFLNHDQANRHRRTAFFTAVPAFEGFDMMGEVFEGIGGRSPVPAAVAAGACRNSLGLQPYAGLVAAAQFRGWLEPGESASWECAYGACAYEAAERATFLARVREVLAAPVAVQSEVQGLWEKRVRRTMARTPDGEFDRFYNIWSKYQARNQARFCRALDKVGYRDVLQDIQSVADVEPGYTRRVLLRTLRYQAADGRAVRQYCLFPGAGHDMRMYMDSSSWIPDCLVTYLKETGDFQLLEESVPYFDMQRQEPDEAVRGTVYEHARQAVRSMAGATGFHGLCRIGYGDWNDALSGIGGDQGVSVWLSCACVHAARHMADLADHLGRTADAQEMRDIVTTLTGRINEHAWDGEWYVYAINGQGKPIGSRTSPEGRIHLNVNTWALITGVARAGGHEEQVWKSLEQLATPFGHMLLSPPYTAASRSDVGRIADQKPGMFENGSIYIHGEAFFLYALICAGRGEQCYRELVRTIPSALVQDVATGPRHQQSNFTVGPDHPNFGLQPFSNFTGSVPWYRRVVQRILGVIPDFDALIIAPQPPRRWSDYEVRKQWRGRDVRVRFRREGGPGCRVVLNGRNYEGRIPAADLPDSGVSRVDVTFG